MPILDTHTVETPEGVDFDIRLAGIGSRFFATVIDATAIIAILMIAQVATSSVIAILDTAIGDLGGFVVAIYLIVTFLVLFGYQALFEIAMKGRTPGHLALGLRTTRLDGGRIGPFAAIIRSLFWPIEVFVFPPIAVISVFASPRNQRLGDIVAGTIVVNNDRALLPPRAVLQAAAYDPNAPFLAWDISRISPADTAVLRSFVERRTQINPAARAQIGTELAAKVRPLVTGVPPHWHAEALLEGIVAAKALRD
jgi:uncharacterized RDD family membrane protein YckC